MPLTWPGVGSVVGPVLEPVPLEADAADEDEGKEEDEQGLCSQQPPHPPHLLKPRPPVIPPAGRLPSVTHLTKRNHRVSQDSPCL